ncbi:hypothetical protein ACFWPK_27275 [Nocardia sp. NPDC058519]|uniref:hypothetical protein n=1 Tax=unclassified Nocardia TaxID=2637762 RepID=UPI00365D43C2
MNTNTNTTFDAMSNRVLVNAFVMSASRGVLALQGTGLSGGDAKASIHLLQDKPSVGWQPTAVSAPAAIADEAGYAPEFTGAIRLRVHPATVIRSRQRCRTR